MKILDCRPQFYREYEMPKELWDEIKLLKSVCPKKNIGEILKFLPKEAMKLVKVGRKKKSFPLGNKLNVVITDELTPPQQ